jgi:hypothetical protein
MTELLAITWFHHRRMEGLCEGLGIELHTLVSKRGRVGRYIELIRRTLALLSQRRPKVLLVQNPSFVLTAFALAMRPWFGYRLVVDAHNEAVEPYILTQGWYRRLTALLLRRADATIVTNRWLSAQVAAVGGHPFVLPDPIPAAVATRGDGARRTDRESLRSRAPRARRAVRVYREPEETRCGRARAGARERPLYRIPARRRLLGVAQHL